MDATPARTQTITADMLAHLPGPARRYLTHAGIIGKPWIDTVCLRYTGRFRTGRDKPWMGISATQVYTTNPPGFRWNARLSLFGLPLLTGQDTYKNGHGHMFGKLARVFTIFDARGDEMDQGTMVRYLNEMIWFPTAFLSDYITWESVSEHAVDVTFQDGGRSVRARLYIDDNGRLMNFVAPRYAENQGTFTMHDWATPITEYGMLGGLQLPVHGKAVWYMPEGDLAYADLNIRHVEYNQPIETF
jgi:hypothetical protein